MPFNVCDRDANHIGFIYDFYPGQRSTLMVTLSEEMLDESQIDYDTIKNQLAGMLNCKNMLGRVKEEKLKEAMETNRAEYSQEGQFSSAGFMKLMFLNKAYAFPHSVLNEVDEEKIKGYVLLDADKAYVKNDVFYIKDDMNYVEEAGLQNEPPVFAQVIDYPVIETDIMGAGTGLLLGGSLADLGGNNHTHITKLKIQSGNCHKDIELPITMHVKRYMGIQFYLRHKRVLCDGVIYSF